MPFFESEWRRYPERYGDACRFLQKLSAEYSLHFFNAKACKIDANQSNFYLWISRMPRGCHDATVPADKCIRNRDVSNGLDLATQLSKRYPQHTLLYVNMGPVPYLDQVFVIRLANTIIAAHGGGSWNAARWLNEALQQRIVEILTAGRLRIVLAMCLRIVIALRPPTLSKRMNRGTLKKGFGPCRQVGQATRVLWRRCSVRATTTSGVATASLR